MTQEQKRLSVTSHPPRSIHSTPTKLLPINIQVKFLASEMWGLPPTGPLSAHLTQLRHPWNGSSGSPPQHLGSASIHYKSFGNSAFYSAEFSYFSCLHHLCLQEQEREIQVRWDCDRQVVGPRTEHWSPQQLCYTGFAHTQSNYSRNSAELHSH